MLCRVFVFFLILLPVVAYADATKKRQELHKLRSRIKEVSNNIEQLRQQKDSLTARLAAIEKQYGKLSVEIPRLQTQVTKKRQRIVQIQHQTAQQKQLIEQQKQQLQGLVRAAYALGKQQKLKLIFNQQDTVVSSRMMKYYEYVNRARIKQLNFIANSVKSLQRLEAEQRQEAAIVIQLVQQQKHERQKLLLASRQRKSLLASIAQDYAVKTQQLSRLKQSERKLGQLITNLQQITDDFPLDVEPTKPFAALKGKLTWPINGKLLNKFGSVRDDSTWDGVLIAADEGTKVRVVTRGRVVYSDWLRGYGQLLIVDHGKQYMSLYAFNQSLYKEEGDWVETGEVIASVGKSGGRKQSGLYFGIRKNGKPINPDNWCRKIISANR